MQLSDFSTLRSNLQQRSTANCATCMGRQYGQTMVWAIHWRPNQCAWRRTCGLPSLVIPELTESVRQAILRNRRFTISEFSGQWLSTTGAQELHIVSLLSDVTSPTTAVHYVSMTSEYVFWAQKSTARCADSTRCTQTRVYSARGKYIVRHWTSREASLLRSSGWGTWSVAPQYRDLRTRALDIGGRLL